MWLAGTKVPVLKLVITMVYCTTEARLLLWMKDALLPRSETFKQLKGCPEAGFEHIVPCINEGF